MFIDHHLCWLTLCLEIPSFLVLIRWRCADSLCVRCCQSSKARLGNDLQAWCGKFLWASWENFLGWKSILIWWGMSLCVRYNKFLHRTNRDFLSSYCWRWVILATFILLITATTQVYEKLSSLTIFFCGTSMQSPYARNTCKAWWSMCSIDCQQSDLIWYSRCCSLSYRMLCMISLVFS